MSLPSTVGYHHAADRPPFVQRLRRCQTPVREPVSHRRWRLLQIVGYAITALDLRQTRRRLRAGLVPFPGYQAVDFSRTSDSASVRPPTLDERLVAVEREVGAIAHRLQTSADEAVARKNRLICR
jgi:hypothetical protein